MIGTEQEDMTGTGQGDTIDTKQGDMIDTRQGDMSPCQNKELITKFYTSFSEGDSEGMVACYHKDIVFEDAAFGKLEGDRAVKMWEMLLYKKKGETNVKFSNIEASDKTGKASWVAEYVYGDTQRKVVNKVSAAFKFEDGKIIEHIDTFDLWLWTKQAMGTVGYLMGWSSFMKNKIQKTTGEKLDAFIASGEA